MMERHVIVACARQFMDVRFMHQGRSEAGLDCLGLLLATAMAAKLNMGQEVPRYSLRPDTVLLRQKLKQFLTPILLTALLPADILLLEIGGLPEHLNFMMSPCLMARR